MTRERKKSILAVIIISICILLVGYIEALPSVGQKCNFGGDCGFNETCKSVPYYQRDGSSYRGICVPKEW